MQNRIPTRRDFLRGSGTLGIAGITGCLRLSTGQGTNQTDGSTTTSVTETKSSTSTQTTEQGQEETVERLFLNSQWTTPYRVSIAKSNDGRFALIGSSESGSRIEAYDKSGESVWSLVWGGNLKLYEQGQAAFTDQALYFGGYNKAEQENQVSTGLVVALENADSDIQDSKWIAHPDGEVGKIEADTALCVVGTNSPDVHQESNNQGRIYAYDSESGQELWKNTTFDKEFIWDLAMHESGVILGTSNRVVRIDSESGEITDTLDDAGVFGGGLQVSGETLILSHEGATAIDLQSDEKLWESTEIPDNVTQVRPVISTQHGQAIIATRTSRVLSFDLNSGDLVWEKQAPTKITQVPRIWDRFLILVDDGGNLQAFDMLNDGKQIAADVETSAPLGVVDDTIFFGGSDNSAYAVETV